ncbi:hypothetical protein ccbrp13_62190 [Ktedonobacteria bacterium brp13]|nr:hypothetical protein ccbrp13_62190 [Ktedonobacteria bacterium brp13]
MLNRIDHYAFAPYNIRIALREIVPDGVLLTPFFPRMFCRLQEGLCLRHTCSENAQLALSLCTKEYDIS